MIDATALQSGSAGPAALQSYIVDHLGIVVPDLPRAVRFYREVLGCAVGEPIVPPDQGIAVAFVQFGNVRIELIAPTTEISPISHVLEDHTVNEFLSRQPSGGLHHVCYAVDDIVAVRERLRAGGIRILGSGEPIIGASGLPILFLDPASAVGTLIEIKQKAL